MHKLLEPFYSQRNFENDALQATKSKTKLENKGILHQIQNLHALYFVWQAPFNFFVLCFLLLKR